MPDIKLYDYQREPRNRQVKWSTYYPMPETNSDTIRCKAPWVDNHMLCCYYDDQQKLIGIRFVYRDGKYVDLIEVPDGD